MKKFLVVAILFLILITGADNKRAFTLLDFFDGEYYAYTETQIFEDSVDLGFCYMNNKVIENEELKGESMVVYNFEPYAALNALSAKIIETEYLEDGSVVMYAYSPLIRETVKFGNKRVNLQICHKNEYSVVGWPLILGSF